MRNGWSVSKGSRVTHVEARSGFPYPLALNSVGEEEIQAAIRVLRSGRLTMGDVVRNFEEMFAEWTGSDFAIMVNSGSSANLLMVEAMVRGPSRSKRWARGDEVIVPALAWPTTIWPLVQAGLVPVFVDVDPGTLAIDLPRARKSLSRRTRGMFLIHVLGQAAAMREVMGFCAEHELEVLEDACESLGAYSGDMHVGTLGVMGSFSFYFSHHLSTIEGGMIVTADEGLADDIRSMRAHGWSRDRADAAKWATNHPHLDPRFLFVCSGFNVRPTELQAAIGISQLARLEVNLATRENIARRVAAVTAEGSSVHLVGAEQLAGPRSTGRPWRPHSWMALAFLLRSGTDAGVGEVTNAFESRGVETRPIIAGNIVAHPALRGVEHRVVEPLAVADRVLTHGFMVGCSPLTPNDSIELLLQALRDLG